MSEIDEQELIAQEAVGSICRCSVLLSDGRWYSYYSSDESNRDAIVAAVKLCMSSTSGTSVPFGKLILCSRHILAVKGGPPMKADEPKDKNNVGVYKAKKE